MYEIDSQEKIILAKTYDLMGKYFRQVTSEIGDGDRILRCAGLSSLVGEYIYEITPFIMNGTWKNPNHGYNPENACFNICNSIESNKQALGLFLKEVFSRVTSIENEDYNQLVNYLEMIGYELVREQIQDEYFDEKYKYSLTPASNGVFSRQEDKSILLVNLQQKHSELVPYYLEAISNYGNAEYKSCVDNSRSIFEGFFRKMDVDNDYAKGILTVTGEQVVDESNTNLLSIKKIFTHWINKKNGANRYRLFVTMYSAMSGLGTHGEELPSKEDALMFLRITEDILLWCLHHGAGF